jgi:hypothetical protein
MEGITQRRSETISNNNSAENNFEEAMDSKKYYGSAAGYAQEVFSYFKIKPKKLSNFWLIFE